MASTSNTPPTPSTLDRFSSIGNPLAVKAVVHDATVTKAGNISTDDRSSKNDDLELLATQESPRAGNRNSSIQPTCESKSHPALLPYAGLRLRISPESHPSPAYPRNIKNSVTPPANGTEFNLFVKPIKARRFSVPAQPLGEGFKLPSPDNRTVSSTSRIRSSVTRKLGMEEELALIRRATKAKFSIFSTKYLGRQEHSAESVESHPDMQNRLDQFNDWRTRFQNSFVKVFFGIAALMLGIVLALYFSATSAVRPWIVLLLVTETLVSLLTLLSCFWHEFFLQIWEAGVIIMMILIEVSIGLYTTSLDSCDTVSLQGNCEMAIQGGILIFVTPLLFGISMVKGIAAVTISWILLTIFIGISTWEHTLDQIGLIFLAFVLYVVVCFVHVREHELFVVHFAFAKKMEESKEDTERAMKILLRMKEQRHLTAEKKANYRSNMQNFELRELQENLNNVREALMIATSHTAEHEIQNLAWASLMAWTKPKVRLQRSKTLRRIHYKVKDSSPKGKRGLLGRHIRSNSRSASAQEEQMNREKNYTVAAVQNIRSWFTRLQTMQGGLGFHLTQNLTEEKMSAKQVFLGGSCNPTTWRKDVAIPRLNQAGISFYDPQVENWTPDLIEVEAKAKSEALCLFFVIDADTRATSSVLETVEYICSGRVVVLAIKEIPNGKTIEGHRITGRELKDLNRGRRYLKDVAERHGVPVFDGVQDAVEFIVAQYNDASMERASSAENVAGKGIMSDRVRNGKKTAGEGTRNRSATETRRLQKGYSSGSIVNICDVKFAKSLNRGEGELPPTIPEIAESSSAKMKRNLKIDTVYNDGAASIGAHKRSPSSDVSQSNQRIGRTRHASTIDTTVTMGTVFTRESDSPVSKRTGTEASWISSAQNLSAAMIATHRDDAGSTPKSIRSSTVGVVV